MLFSMGQMVLVLLNFQENGAMMVNLKVERKLVIAGKFFQRNIGIFCQMLFVYYIGVISELNFIKFK